MDTANLLHVQRQIEQLLKFGKIDLKCRDALLEDLTRLDEALQAAADPLDVVAQLATLGFRSLATNDQREIVIVLPSCGGLPVDFRVPPSASEAIQYGNRRRFLERAEGNIRAALARYTRFAKPGLS